MKYKDPSEYKTAKEDRLPVGARIKVSKKLTLERAAKGQGMSLGELLSKVIEDYAEWLEKSK